MKVPDLGIDDIKNNVHNIPILGILMTYATTWAGQATATFEIGTRYQ